MSTALPITIAGVESTQVSALPEAIARRDQLLAIARKGKIIANADSAARATNLLRELKTFAKSIEDSHQQVKRPVLDLGKRIDELSYDLTHEVNAEAKRISRLIGDFNVEQERIRREAKAKADAEAQKIREEAERQQREIREKAEAEAKAREAAQAPEQAPQTAVEKANAARAEVAAKAKADAEAERIRKEAEAQVKALNKALVPAKPEGVATRTEIEFNVDDVAALFASNPSLVTLTPNRAAIKEALKKLADGETLPGVRHWAVAKAVVR